MPDLNSTERAVQDAATETTRSDQEKRVLAHKADRAEYALHASEQQYRALFESAPDAVLLIDTANLALLDANAAASALFGYAHEELIGMPLLELSLQPHETWRTVAEATEFIPYRRLKRKDGSEFLAEIAASEMNFDGTRARVAFIRDITERVAVDAAHEASTRKYAAAFAASPDSVNINRLEDGLYVEVNEGFTRLTGWTAEEAVGKTSAEIQIWADLQDRHNVVEAVRANGHVDNYEAEFRDKYGRVRTGSMSATVIDVGGVPHLLSVTRDVSEQKHAAEQLELSNTRLAEMVRDITRTLGRVVEIRDPYTHGHQERVAQVSRAIAHEMGLDAADIEAIEMSALVHDVGKLAVPAEILNKPGTLSAVEFGLIQVHSEKGHEILSGVDFPWPMAKIVLQHHERQDGSGYPSGLAGDEILMPARILAIADVVEAMASYRPYRPALGLTAAIGEIERFPQRFDADARDACLSLHQRGVLTFLDA